MSVVGWKRKPLESGARGGDSPVRESDPGSGRDPE